MSGEVYQKQKKVLVWKDRVEESVLQSLTLVINWTTVEFELNWPPRDVVLKFTKLQFIEEQLYFQTYDCKVYWVQAFIGAISDSAVMEIPQTCVCLINCVKNYFNFLLFQLIFIQISQTRVHWSNYAFQIIPYHAMCTGTILMSSTVWYSTEQYSFIFISTIRSSKIAKFSRSIWLYDLSQHF